MQIFVKTCKYAQARRLCLLSPSFRSFLRALSLLSFLREGAREKLFAFEISQLRSACSNAFRVRVKRAFLDALFVSAGTIH